MYTSQTRLGLLARSRMAGIVLFLLLFRTATEQVRGRKGHLLERIFYLNLRYNYVTNRCVVEINYHSDLVSDCLKRRENVQMLVLYLRRIEVVCISFSDCFLLYFLLAIWIAPLQTESSLFVYLAHLEKILDYHNNNLINRYFPLDLPGFDF